MMARFISVCLFIAAVSLCAHGAITIDEALLESDSNGYFPDLTSLGTADWMLMGKSGAAWSAAETKNILQPLLAIDSQSTAAASVSGSDSNRFTWSDGKPTTSGSDESVSTRLQVSGTLDTDTDVTVAVSTLEAGKMHRFYALLGSKRSNVNVSYSIDGGTTFTGTQTYTGNAGSSTGIEHQYSITYTPSDSADVLYVRFEWNSAEGVDGQQQAMFDAVALNAPLNEAPNVDAGSQYQVGPMSSTKLSGSYTDDGMPEGGEVTVHWSMVEASDPNYVIDDPNVLETTISFQKAGIYTLNLTVSDGEISGSDEIIVRAKDDTLFHTLQAHFQFDPNDPSDPYHQYTNDVDSPEIVGGKIGKALSLSKGDILTYGLELGAETSISFAYWINPAADVASDSNKGIVGKYSTNSNDPQGGWTLQFRNETEMRMRCSSGYSGGAGELKVTSTLPVKLCPIGEWTHVTGTFDGETGEMKFYINSELVDSRTTGQTSFDPVTEFQIGSADWAGMVDDIFIYDYVISQDELRAVFTRGGNAPPMVDIIEEQAKVILPDNEVALNWAVFDEDGNTVAWKVLEGPQEDVTFTTDDDAKVTTAHLDTAGNYLLQITATDTKGLSNDDQVVVKVRPEGFDGLEAHITFAGKDPNSYLSTGVGYPVTVLGDPGWSTRGNDDPNDALLLDGTDDALDYGRYLGSDPECTIMAWIKPENIGENQFILGKWPNNSSEQGWMIRLRSEGNLAAMIGSGFNGPGNYFQVRDPHTDEAFPLTVGEWVHVALTFDGSTQSLYQDGVLVNREEDVEYSADDLVTPMVIGYRTDGDREYFDGSIDEVRIYDYALTTEQIKAIYSGDGGEAWQTCDPQLTGDINADCRVDLLDMAAIGAGWASTYDIATLVNVAMSWLECDDFDMSKCGDPSAVIGGGGGMGGGF